MCSKQLPMCGSRMKRTFFYQATETARVTFSGVQWPLHSTKCISWVAISKHGIIGPFWFEDENGQSVMVNFERYLVLLRKFWAALGRRRGITGVDNGFSKMGPPLTLPITLYCS